MTTAPISSPRPLARVQADPMARAAGKVPPHDLDAEAAVLSTLLLDVRRLPQVQLRAADFYSEANGRIYSAIVELAADERAVDTVTVAGLLRDRQRLASIGGPAYLAQIVDATPSVANVSAHAERVAQLAQRRRLIDRAHRIAAEGYDAPEGWDAEAVRQLAEVVAAPVAPPADPIRSAWRPVGLAALETRPEPRRWLLRHPTRDWQPCDPAYGDGMLPLGKAGVLSAEGGAGKTQLLVQLAVSIITGRRWLDHFVVGAEARGKRVLLALAEEDAEEIDRRCYDVAAALQLTADERALVASRLVALPLAGTPVALLRRAEGGSLAETPELASLRRLLTEDAGEGWALVVLDPLSRWAGPDAEAENEAATRTVQALESLVRVPGGPTVLCAAHSSKLARRTGTVDTRGVTAITDGLRWEGQLRVVDAEVHFRQAKSNYSRPMPESREIELVRGADGVLRVPSADERDRRAAEDHGAAERAIGADVARVVDALARERQASSVDAIAGLAGMKLTAGRRAVRLAMDRGLITRVGTAREPLYRVCEETPIPPGTSGRPADVTRETSGTPGGGRPGRSGTSRDVGTSSHWIEQVDP